MILSSEQIAHRRKIAVEMASLESSALSIHYQRELDALDTIADLKRQLAERGAAIQSEKDLADKVVSLGRNLDPECAFDQALKLIHAYVQEQVDRAVLAESEAIADRWNGFTKSRLPFEKWLFERLAANRAKVKL